jgi:hypothetical protein
MEIGIVSEFNYLGVLFSKSGNFSMAKKSSSKESHKSYVRSFTNIITVSSAYSIMKSFRYTFKSLSMRKPCKTVRKQGWPILLQLKVNVEKSKNFVFSRERLPNNLTFTFNEMEIGKVLSISTKS